MVPPGVERRIQTQNQNTEGRSQKSEILTSLFCLLYSALSDSFDKIDLSALQFAAIVDVD
jgi:hypothetical protein